MTKNAVIGKARRLELPARQSGWPKPEPSAPPAEVAKSLPESKPEPVSTGNVHMTKLEDHHCKWPLWDNSQATTFLFCGERRQVGSPYCSAHSARAFNRPVVKVSTA